MLVHAMDNLNSSCHRVFHILDILRLILDNLSGDKKSLLYLACCSRTLSSPSLDYLWADLDSLAPFVPLLPNAVQEIVADTVDLPPPAHAGQRWRMTIRVLRDITPKVSLKIEDWTTFDAYAHRVRRIRHAYHYRELFSKLIAIRPGVHLFPKLLSLQFDLPNDLEPGMKFFPSSLQSLTMYNLDGVPHNDGGSVEIAVRQAALDAPLLEELHFVGIYRPLVGTEPTPLDFKQLRTLHLNVSLPNDVDVERLWCIFGTLPIQTLKINIRDWLPQTRDLPNSQPTPVFSNVKTITINNGPLLASVILSRISSPHLHSVIIDSHDISPKVEEYEQFFSQCHPSIRSLEVRMGSFCTVYPDFLRRFLAALEPLIRSVLLRLRLELPLHSTCRSEGAIPRKLTPDAWPTLKYFEFVPLTPPPGPSR